MLGFDVELENPTAPDAEVDLAVGVGAPIVPDLFHGSVLLGVDGPLPGSGVVAAGASGGGGPDVLVLDANAVDDIVDQSTVELMEVVEATAAEPGQTTTEHSQPDLTGIRMYGEG